MIIKNFLLVLLFAASLSSCVVQDGDNSGSGAVSDADGVWTSACKDLSDEWAVGSFKTTSTVAAGVHHWSLAFYSDAACSTIVTLKVFSGTFTTGSTVSAPAGFKEFNSRMTTFTVTLYTDDQVSMANSGPNKICSGGFTKGVAKTFTAADCESDNNNKFGGETFNIYKVDGSKLYFGVCGEDGTATDCKAPTRRPTTLPTDYVTKI